MLAAARMVKVKCSSCGQSKRWNRFSIWSVCNCSTQTWRKWTRNTSNFYWIFWDCKMAKFSWLSLEKKVKLLIINSNAKKITFKFSSKCHFARPQTCTNRLRIPQEQRLGRHDFTWASEGALCWSRFEVLERKIVLEAQNHNQTLQQQGVALAALIVKI